MCSDVLSFSNMLDSGMLTYFSHLEWSFSENSRGLGNPYASTSLWNQASRGDMIHRWKNELRLLTVAIGQQARLTGDVTIPEWARDLDLQKALNQTEKETLDHSEILAQNSLRYWLDAHRVETEKHDGATAGSDEIVVSFPLRYAFAFDACAPDYLRSLTNYGPAGETDFSKIGFQWTANVVNNVGDAKSLVVDDPNKLPNPCPTTPEKQDRWCTAFEGLANCILLPTPDEVTTGELRRAGNLEALLESRTMISNLLETTQLIESMQDNDRFVLLEALTMQWAYEKRTQQDVQENTTTKPALTASRIAQQGQRLKSATALSSDLSARGTANAR
jgi:hypothetical protein